MVLLALNDRPHSLWNRNNYFILWENLNSGWNLSWVRHCFPMFSSPQHKRYHCYLCFVKWDIFMSSIFHLERYVSRYLLKLRSYGIPVCSFIKFTKTAKVRKTLLIIHLLIHSVKLIFLETPKYLWWWNWDKPGRYPLTLLASNSIRSLIFAFGWFLRSISIFFDSLAMSEEECLLNSMGILVFPKIKISDTYLQVTDEKKL